MKMHDGPSLFPGVHVPAVRNDAVGSLRGIPCDTEKQMKPDYIHSCYDAGPGVFDRYTVVFHTSHGRDTFDVLGVSTDPEHPLGFSQYCGEFTPEEVLGWEGFIPWRKLPENVQRHVIEHYTSP